jgi:hypothetical protein
MRGGWRDSAGRRFILLWHQRPHPDNLGISRDAAEEKFVSEYLRDDILQENPFETLDQNGVGELVKMAH